MTWVKVDDSMPDHPRMLGLSDAALAAWLRGLCYSSRFLLDGDLPAAAVAQLGRPKAIAELVDRDLWRPTLSGWSIVNYGEHQRTRVEVEQDRSRSSERQRRKRDRDKGTPQLPGVTQVSRRDTAVSHAFVTLPETETETETYPITPFRGVKGGYPQPVDNDSCGLCNGTGWVDVPEPPGTVARCDCLREVG